MPNVKAKIVFMGSPEFAVPTLKGLVESQHEIVACFTREAKPKNRGKNLEDTVIATIAKENGIDVYTPKTLRDYDMQGIIKSLEPDFLVVVAYGLLLPKEILDISKYGALNLHPSSLPRFRGAAPIQRTIMAGDTHTDICIMQMNEQLDEGDILLKEGLIIPSDMTAGELHDKAAIIGSKLMLKTIEDYQNITPNKQPEENLCYAKKISKEEAKINLLLSGDEIMNLIRGLNPYPGAYFEYNSTRYKIFSASFNKITHKEKPGYINQKFQLYCKDGIITPKIIQKSGKNKILLEEMLRGM